MKKVLWSLEAQRALKPACRGDDEIIKQQVLNGESNLYQGDDGFVVLRGEGLELVIVAGAGKQAKNFYNEITCLAKNSGFKSLRTHVVRRGLMRILERSGFDEAERVYRKRL